MNAEELMAGYSFHVDAEEFASDTQAMMEFATGSTASTTTTFCCSVQCC
ncbi:LxmA leader domain family RiPP [Streptomyces lavendulae]